jgi:uncharacterized membrane protein YoaK (UPF0700 family)
MPIDYLSRLAGAERTAQTNLHLGAVLAFVAGTLNAGGFLAIGQYTSHMTGMVSSAADHLVLGNFVVMAAALLSIASFTAGAASTAILVSYARRTAANNIYTPTLLLEAALILVFGLAGSALQSHSLVNLSFTAVLLCYTMGLQNALVTKVSNAEIRTTHVTGLVTDFGIELGRLLYWNAQRDAQLPKIIANRRKLMIHAGLVLAFFIGGVAGAVGFKFVGFASTIPIALALTALAFAPALRHPAAETR